MHKQHEIQHNILSNLKINKKELQKAVSCVEFHVSELKIVYFICTCNNYSQYMTDMLCFNELEFTNWFTITTSQLIHSLTHHARYVMSRWVDV